MKQAECGCLYSGAVQFCNLHANAAALLEALRVLVDHAQETYPHFESERGQRDIQAALDAIAKVEGKA